MPRWCKAGLTAKTACLLAFRLAHAVGAEARRANVNLAPKRAEATDGVVLARWAEVFLFAGHLAILFLLLALISAVRLARVELGNAIGLAVSQDDARRRRGNRRRRRGRRDGNGWRLRG